MVIEKQHCWNEWGEKNSMMNNTVIAHQSKIATLIWIVKSSQVLKRVLRRSSGSTHRGTLKTSIDGNFSL